MGVGSGKGTDAVMYKLSLGVSDPHVLPRPLPLHSFNLVISKYK